MSILRTPRCQIRHCAHQLKLHDALSPNWGGHKYSVIQDTVAGIRFHDYSERRSRHSLNCYWPRTRSPGLQKTCVELSLRLILTQLTTSHSSGSRRSPDSSHHPTRGARWSAYWDTSVSWRKLTWTYSSHLSDKVDQSTPAADRKSFQVIFWVCAASNLLQM